MTHWPIVSSGCKLPLGLLNKIDTIFAKHDPCEKISWTYKKEWRSEIRILLRIGRQVAVKVIDKKKAREDAYVCRNMRRESRLLQQIKHRNIIQLFEV